MACLLTELFLKSFSKALTCQNHFPETLFSEAFKRNTHAKIICDLFPLCSLTLSPFSLLNLPYLCVRKEIAVHNRNFKNFLSQSIRFFLCFNNSIAGQQDHL